MKTVSVFHAVVVMALALLQAGTFGLSHAVAQQSQVASFSASVDGLPQFRRGINIARLFNLPWRDSEDFSIYKWPTFDRSRWDLSDDELARLKIVGFDYVRLPVDPGPFLQLSSVDQRLLLDELRFFVLRFQGHGLNVIVDVHPSYGGSVWSPPEILSDLAGEKFKRYGEFLQQLARRFRDLPQDSFALELMNEPQSKCVSDSGPDWSEAQALLFKQVRRVAPGMALVVTGGCWSSYEGLQELDPRAFDARTFYMIHFYDPHPLTHQSRPWVSYWAKYAAGISYPASEGSLVGALSQTREFLEREEKAGRDIPMMALIDATAGLTNYYMREAPDRAYIEERFDKIQEWARQGNVPANRIIIGEFGMHKPAEGVADDGSRARWLHDVRRAAESRGYGWAHWDYFAGFGIVDDNAERVFNPEVMRALGLESGDEVTPANGVSEGANDTRKLE